MQNKILGGLAMAVAMMVGSVAQAADRYGFDTVHSQIIFFASHLGFSFSEGEFLDFKGSFEFDEKDWSKSSVDVEIDANSLSMDDAKWDEHMKSADFFDVAKFPTITFKSTKVSSADAKTGQIAGLLTVLGVSKPVVLDVTLNKVGVHPFKNTPMAGFSATTKLKRSDFGMNYGIPAVGDEIEIRIEVEAPKL